MIAMSPQPKPEPRRPKTPAQRLAYIREWKSKNRDKLNARARELRASRKPLVRKLRKDRVMTLGRVCARCKKPLERKPNEQLSGSFRKREFCDKSCGTKAKQRKNVLARGGPIKKHLDKWFSMIVRSVGACVKCGAIERLQCAHIVSRRYLGVRFSLDNALCLCAGCHMYYTYRPLEWETYITDRMGAEAFDELKRRALSFKGPLDRAAVAQELYVEADRVGVHFGKGGKPAGGTWVGMRDPEAMDRESGGSGDARLSGQKA